ncbi:O-antigen ligase family protein [Sulfurimonas sp. HSL3-7]|uniref:O-antigen ligase family protein n=1 Tax=Sulfonitrofixus jiaomeiensis TaxID=3131938 RepID=UPI0031F92907
MNKIVMIFLTILFFKPFGLDQVDKFGLTLMPMFAATKIFRILWIFLVAAFLIYLIYKLYMYWRRNPIQIEIPIFSLFFSILYSYVLITSFMLSQYADVLGFYRLLELLIVMTSILVLLSATSFKSLNLLDLIQKALLINFYLIILILLFWLVKDHSMIFQLETQGRVRLGGSVYSPNELGIIGSLSMWSAYYLLFKNHISKKFFVFTLLIALIIVVLTNSRTSMVIAFGSILFMLHKQNLINKLAIIGMTFIGMIFLFSTFNIDRLGYGNDPLEELKTLNNRTYIYEVAFDGIIRNPWFGVGYVEGTKEFLKENFTQDFWLPPHTHNGYIEIALSLGIPFFVLVMLISTRLFFLSFRNIIFNTNKITVASSMQLIIIMVTAMTTVDIGNAVNPLFVLFLFYLLTNGQLLQDPHRNLHQAGKR